MIRLAAIALIGFLGLIPSRVMAQAAAPFAATACTVGTGSTQCLAAGVMHSITVQNVSTGANVACTWGGTPALNAAGSIMLSAGQSFTFGPGTSGVPGSILNCIASAAGTPLTIIGY